MTKVYDQPGAVRESEALPAETLAAWIGDHVEGFSGALEVLQFRKGHSNLTYAVGDGTRSWVLRRAPFGTHAASAHDMSREWRILSALARGYDKAPQPVAYCDDESVIGAPFYVMERLEGVILRSSPPKGLEWSESLGDRLCSAFVDELVALHAVDLDAIGLAEFGRPQGYVARQISGWTSRYTRSQTDDIADMDRLATWLDEAQPGESGAALIHNDFKYDNLVLDPDDPSRIVGILDWEMATVGDPWMDVGSTLGYWIEADDGAALQMMPFRVAAFPGTWSRARVVEAYAERSGRAVGAPAFYHAYGLFKLAVVAQQIYARFAAGLTDDPRFGMMIQGVRALAALGVRGVDDGR